MQRLEIADEGEHRANCEQQDKEVPPVPVARSGHAKFQPWRAGTHNWLSMEIGFLGNIIEIRIDVIIL